jgi:DNA-directed RNA polymerase specialized sigma24 family protein
MTTDHFPPTLRTWIGEEWQRGAEGRLEVKQKLMQTYYEPLRIYYQGTNHRWMGEPDDIVNGFFASRLERDDFIPKWQASGKRLRRWLMTALNFYLRELRRDYARSSGRGDTPTTDLPTFSGDPETAVNRASAVAFVRQAALETEQLCVKEDLADHWRAFVRHHIEGAPFREISAELKVNEARAAVMSRTAQRKFQSTLREVLSRDGVGPHEMDQEIKSLLEAME